MATVTDSCMIRLDKVEERCGVPAALAKTLMEQELLTHVNVGNVIYVDPKELRDAIETHRETGPPKRKFVGLCARTPSMTQHAVRLLELIRATTGGEWVTAATLIDLAAATYVDANLSESDPLTAFELMFVLARRDEDAVSEAETEAESIEAGNDLDPHAARLIGNTFAALARDGELGGYILEKSESRNPRFWRVVKA